MLQTKGSDPPFRRRHGRTLTTLTTGFVEGSNPEFCASLPRQLYKNSVAKKKTKMNYNIEM